MVFVTFTTIQVVKVRRVPLTPTLHHHVRRLIPVKARSNRAREKCKCSDNYFMTGREGMGYILEEHFVTDSWGWG